MIFLIKPIGRDICFADERHTDTPDNKWNKADKNLYIYCTCKKSTIMRVPGM